MLWLPPTRRISCAKSSASKVSRLGAPGRADVEVMDGNRPKRILSFSGQVYLALIDCPGAIEGMLEAICHGRPPADVLEQARLTAVLTL